MRVIVVGDGLIDETLTLRHKGTECGAPVFDVVDRMCVGGGAFNVVRALDQLGAKACYVGFSMSGNVQGALTRTYFGVKQLCRKVRLLHDDGQELRYDEDDVFHPGKWHDEIVREAFDAECHDMDACVLSDYGKGFVTEGVAKHVVESCARLGKPCVVDPYGTDWSRYKGAAVVKATQDQVLKLGKIATHVRYELGCPLVMTMGQNGACVFGTEYFSRFVPLVVVDRQLVGAGDAMAAGLAYYLACDRLVDMKAVEFAHECVMRCVS